MLNKQLQFEDSSAAFTTKNLAEKIPHLSIVFTLIFIDRGHCVTNPNNAPENGQFPKATIRLHCLILSTWAQRRQRGRQQRAMQSRPVDKAFSFALSLSAALGSRLSTLAEVSLRKNS